MHRSVSPEAIATVIDAHERSGQRVTAAGVSTFVLDQGYGEPVVCLHGVPASSFLFRKLVPALAARGLRGLAFDLPGLGLADRPVGFDYSWSGLGAYAAELVDALNVDRFHLVVHDIGAPVGFELAARRADRVHSLTVLNAPVAVANFRRPLVMKPFAVRGLGELVVRAMPPIAFRGLMRWQGIADQHQVTTAELDAYLALLRRGDGGRAFLKIMRGFELTRAKQDLYEQVLRYPGRRVQLVWSTSDPALPIRTRGEQARRVAGVDEIHAIPGKHFFPEDQTEALADLVAIHVLG